jgi:hypothetical protein
MRVSASSPMLSCSRPTVTVADAGPFHAAIVRRESVILGTSWHRLDVTEESLSAIPRYVPF